MALTPMMQQYVEIKKEYSEYILMYRLGDFYEMFFEDAITVSRELKITLTGKSCGLEERAPMCGVPFHAVEPYIKKLIGLGYKIAICEQVEDPKKTKGIVKREVTKIITPGTNINLDVDLADQNNYLCSVVKNDNTYGLAFIDITTGKFKVTEIKNSKDVFDEIKKIAPVEIIYNSKLDLSEINIIEYAKKEGRSCSELSNSYFDLYEVKDQIIKQFNINSINSLGLENEAMILSVGSIIRYIYETQKAFLSNIINIEIYSIKNNMIIDSFTVRNLELIQTMRDARKKGSLFGILDRTKTAMGARFLRNEILSPSLDTQVISKRYDAIDDINSNLMLRDEVREYLSNIYDIERVIAKLNSNNINPRDMLAILQSINNISPIYENLLQNKSKLLIELRENIDLLEDIKKLLEESINEDAGLSLREGNIIKQGYNAEIDEYRNILYGGKDWISDIEKEEKERTGIKNLRIKFSKNFGYCIEINKAFANAVPSDYIRRQTLTNAERYTFEKLKLIEDKILGAEDRLYKLELEIFNNIKLEVIANINRILNTAKAVSEIDFIYSLAYTAYVNAYTRPKLVDDGSIKIIAGRHPVVEKIIGRESFIPNDVRLDMESERVSIITGPNMSGKSTYMRQTALIVLMAQIGSFVPAEICELDIVDRIFTRVGASDDLASGQSTFMVEMTEVANILRNANSRSLLILDEIGRGTSTFDGLSLAWAIIEYIANPNIIGAKTLFATHYHELTELEGKLDNVVNYYIDVFEKDDKIIFLRKILRGGANKSYGIQVAKLAGLPKEVITRAKQLANSLDQADITKNINNNTVSKQLNLFEIIQEDSDYYNKLDELKKEILLLDVDDISPKKALEYLYEFKKRFSDV